MEVSRERHCISGGDAGARDRALDLGILLIRDQIACLSVKPGMAPTRVRVRVVSGAWSPVQGGVRSCPTASVPRFIPATLTRLSLASAAAYIHTDTHTHTQR